MACAGLGLWLGTTVADDVGSGEIAVIVAACAVLGSFAPTTIRWVAAGGPSRRSRS